MTPVAADLPPSAPAESKPLAGKRLGVVKETLGEGVSAQVKEAVLQVRGQVSRKAG